jgi:esterase/lipase superfamily enzyme
MLAGDLVAICQEIPNATLIDVRVVMDGSADPPGDRLDVSLILSENAPALTLELRAFSIAEEDNSQATRIRARGNSNRDQDGNLLVMALAQRPESGGVSQVAIVVPYSDLDLPVGKHQMAYEIRGVRAGRIEFVRPTQLSLVTVSTQARNELEQRSAAPASTTTRTLNIVIGSERTRGEKPKPIEEHDVRVSETVSGIPDVVKKIRVNIPNGFNRAEVLASEPNEDAPLRQIPSRPLSEFRPANERIVYYATNRLANDQAKTPATKFGNTRSDEVTWGECVVNIPVEQHHSGVLEEPGWWDKRNADKHFLIESLHLLALDQLKSKVKDGDVLLFVHGYKYTFERAVLRTAQLHYDLEFEGRALAFTWPSAGELTGYDDDAGQARSSVDALTVVLHELISMNGEPSGATDGSRKVHVIAHSMGNRILLGAIQNLYERRSIPPNSRPFGQIILAAPDVGKKAFNESISLAINAAEQTTCYYCQKDTALKLSMQINNEPPVGLSPFFQDGLDTICADYADTSFISHGYYASSNLVLLDMKLMVRDGLSPSKRHPPLSEPTLLSNFRHWSFVPTRVADK